MDQRLIGGQPVNPATLPNDTYSIGVSDRICPSSDRNLISSMLEKNPQKRSKIT
jgi:hypothetical protein